jgi:hypothetical protein
MRTIVLVVLASGCVYGMFGTWNTNNSVGENMRGCISDRCPDNDAAADRSAEDLARLAVEAARRGDCTCAFALENATVTKDRDVHTQLLHDPAIVPCFDPKVRRALWPEATRPGTLTRCLG